MTNRTSQFFVLLLTLSFFGFAHSASAATFFVRSGSSGNGTSWTSAWSNLSQIDWAQITPGTTICIAGGSYGPFTIPKSGNSTGRITLKRATSADTQCSSGTGWSSSYDSQVVIGQPTDNNIITGVNTSYITIDGVVPSGILVQFGQGDFHGTGIKFSGNSNVVELKNIEVDSAGFHDYGHPVDCGMDASKCGHDGVVFNGSTSGGLAYDQRPNYALISGLKITDCSVSIRIAHADYPTIERSDVSRNTGSGPGDHADVYYIEDSNNGVFRYNSTHEYWSEGLYFTGYSTYGNWKIYSNTFWDSTGGKAGQTGIAFDNNSATMGMFYIYNNVFANINSPLRTTVRGFGSQFAGGELYNNIFWKSGSPLSMTHDNNWYSDASNFGETNGVAGGAADPFAGSANANYRLAAGSTAIDHGRTLASEFATDMASTMRLSPWDIGAYEYSTGGSSVINGQCGTTVNVCTFGSFSDIADTATTYQWSCIGSGGGTTAQCNKPVTTVPTSTGTGGTCVSSVNPPPANTTSPCNPAGTVLSTPVGTLTGGTSIPINIQNLGTAGTMWIYSKIYLSDKVNGSYVWKECTGSGAGATTCLPVTLTATPGTNIKQDTLKFLVDPSGLSKPDIHYVLSWDWSYNGSCYLGPGSTACNTGNWRIQMFSL